MAIANNQSRLLSDKIPISLRMEQLTSKCLLKIQCLCEEHILETLHDLLNH